MNHSHIGKTTIIDNSAAIKNARNCQANEGANCSADDGDCLLTDCPTANSINRIRAGMLISGRPAAINRKIVIAVRLTSKYIFLVLSQWRIDRNSHKLIGSQDALATK